MPIPKLPVQSLDDINHRRRTRETLNLVLDHTFDDSRVRTAAEIAAGVTPINTAYAPGDVRRYGADPSGVADSTSAIQAALDGAMDSGGTINLVEGVYRIEGTVTTGPLDNKRTTIVGYGATLKQYDSSVNTVNIRNSRVQIVGVKFETDSSVTPSAGVSAIDILDVSDVSVTDCVFYQLATNGITVRSDVTQDCTDVSIKGCHFTECEGTSIVVNSEDNATYVRRVSIVNNTFNASNDPISNQTRAIHLSSNATDVTISANVCSGVGASDYSTGWRDCFMVGHSSASQRPERITITGNEITGMGDDGVGISGAVDVSVTGNIIHGSILTSGVYVPGDGTWSNDNVTISGNTIFNHALAGIFLKDTLSYSITGNTISDCDQGIYVNDNGVTILRGSITGNTIHTVERQGILWDGGACSCSGNIIDGFGDSGSAQESDKAAIFVASAASGSIISDNVIMNGIHGLLLNSNPSQFIVSDNVVRSSCTGYGIYFLSFTGDNFTISGNQLRAATGAFQTLPTLSGTKRVSGNSPIASDGLSMFTAMSASVPLTPAQITADQNDYNPTGFLEAFHIRLSSNASRTITGMARDGNAHLKILTNNGAQDIVFAHESASSTANQRFQCKGGANYTMTAGASVLVIYDTATSSNVGRWRLVQV